MTPGFKTTDKHIICSYGISFVLTSLLFTAISAIFIPDSKLQAPDRQPGDHFGYSVAISNNYLVIGAKYEDNGASNAGAAYVYEKDNLEWKIQKIQASDKQTSDHFGTSVDISNNYIVIGAPWVDDDNAGAAYVYKRNASAPTSWNQIQKIQPSDGSRYNRYFGEHVAIYNEYIVIGSHLYGTYGAAYVYKINNLGSFEEIQKLQSSDKSSYDYFGSSVAISNNYIVIGAHSEDTGGIGTFTTRYNAGSVYIFEKNNFGLFVEVQKIQASDKAIADQFGDSVSISNNYLVVGSAFSDSVGQDTGAAYVFERDIVANVWNEAAKLQHSQPHSSDYFGSSVDISNDYLAVGARKQDNTDAGAVYVYMRDSNADWNEIQMLQASDIGGFNNEYFGYSVSISNDRLVVGAYGANLATGAAYTFYNSECALPVENNGMVRFVNNDKYMSYASDLGGFFMQTNDNTLEMYLDSTFRQIKALNNEKDCYSFESLHYKNYY
eukprot:414562_1